MTLNRCLPHCLDFRPCLEPCCTLIRAFQYTHKTYQERLGSLQILGSHSRKGNCLDNACAESFFSHLNTELFTDNQPLPKDETIAVVEAYIPFYNKERFQKRLGQLSPVEYREKLAA